LDRIYDMERKESIKLFLRILIDNFKELWKDIKKGDFRMGM